MLKGNTSETKLTTTHLGIMIANDLKYIHQIENIQVLLFKAYFSRLFFFELNKLS